MYITCEQCSTIFRLDETRLKPTGSKVRCSQCGNLFIARPATAPEPEGFHAPAMSQPAPAAKPSRAEDPFDQELEGIDLAELDSILEQDRSEDFSDTLADDAAGSVGLAAEEPIALDEADLDLDFESALELGKEDETRAAVDTPDREDEELDLDMDFELAAEGPPVARETSTESELSPDELDMDFELDGDANLESAAEPASTADSGATDLAEDIEMALDDFEEALGRPEEAPVDDLTHDVIADEDLSLDMDFDLEEESAASGTADENLELSLDEGTEDRSEQKQEEVADDLDLSDLGSVLDEDAPPSADIDIADEDLELSLDEDAPMDIDEGPAHELESDSPQGARSDQQMASEMQTEDIDLTDLDDLLDEDDQHEQTADMEDVELSLDEDIESVLEAEPPLEPETDTNNTSEMVGDDLDLAGLDDLLDEVDEVADQPENEDLELSLDDRPEAEGRADQKADGELGDLEDLEFELDAEFEDKPVSKAVAEEQSAESASQHEEDEELDLSDIEQMLEDDTLMPEAAASAEDAGDDLMAGAEKWVEDTPNDFESGEEGEIDLSEIEAAIDAADEEGGEGIDLDEELAFDLESETESDDTRGDEPELKLELESESSAREEEFLGDASEEIDLSDLDLSIEEDKPVPEADIVNADDMELEFQIEEDAEQLVDFTATSSAETIAAGQTTRGYAKTTGGAVAGGDQADDESLIQEAFTAPTAEAGKAEKKKAPPRKKKGSSKSLIFVLILALLGGGGYFGYDYVMKNNIQIPYLSDFINPQPKDPSNIAKLSTLEINSKFIENANAGRLFVITGKVRNGYTVPCKMIRLQGKLFTKGKALVKTEQVYAGVTFSDQELANQELAQIKQRLEAPTGKDAAIVANPGQSVPFMVVFSDLPSDLDEFAVELMNSAKAQ